MGLLDGAGLAYNLKLVRPASLKRGDIIEIDDERAVVLNVDKAPLVGDESVLDELRDASKDDKIAPGFDEEVIIEVVLVDSVFDSVDEDYEVPSLEPRRAVAVRPEWGIIEKYV